MKYLQVPIRPLSLPERRLTSVPANSGTPYVPFFSKGHAEIFREFWHDFAKKGTYGVPEFAKTEVNRRSGKLKGLMGTDRKSVV